MTVLILDSLLSSFKPKHLYCCFGNAPGLENEHIRQNAIVIAERIPELNIEKIAENFLI